MDDVEPVVEVLAESALLDLGSKVPVRRGDDPDVDLDGRVRTDALELPLLEDAQELGLGGQRHLTDLVEEDRALVGGLEAALAHGHRPGERPLLVAEQLGLEERLGQRGAADLDQWMGVALAGPMQRLGDELLAGPRLAGDEDGGVAAGDLADELEDLQHRLRRADDALALGRALAQLQSKCADLEAHVGVLEDPAQRGEEVVDLERLGDVVVGAVLHGLDRRGAAAEGRHHDHLELIVLALQLAQDRQPVLVRELDVHHHEVRTLLLIGHRREGLGAGRGRGRPVAVLGQQIGQELTDVLVVVDDEDLSPIRAGGVDQHRTSAESRGLGQSETGCCPIRMRPSLGEVYGLSAIRTIRRVYPEGSADAEGSADSAGSAEPEASTDPDGSADASAEPDGSADPDASGDADEAADGMGVGVASGLNREGTPSTERTRTRTKMPMTVSTHGRARVSFIGGSAPR